MGGIRRVWGLLGPDWEAGLRRLPFFTQRTAVLLLGVLVATLALLGGVVALVGWPGANGPNRLVPGEQAGRAPVSRPGPGAPAAPGARTPEAGDRSGADAGGAAPASPAPADPARPVPPQGPARPAPPTTIPPGSPRPCCRSRPASLMASCPARPPPPSRSRRHRGAAGASSSARPP